MRTRGLIFILIAWGIAAALVAQQLPPQVTPPPALMIVLDAGHGGTDTGARGTGGLQEKDLTLALARAVRAELERAGYRVALTRDADTNPSFDDRAAYANARRGIFVSLHVSSNGTVGSARAFYYEFSAADSSQGAMNNGLLNWERAQAPFAVSSRRLAEFLQTELARQFASSPQAPAGAAVRSLRSIATPAIAVEVSSVGAKDAGTIERMGAPLGGSLVRALAAFRPQEGGR